ncbi:MAG TPA: TonB-dependent receptor plug domain-containing protein, partial [Polyangiaceae bacterium]|nr:TonB-dependent receptor plug domain-containing protein [Polyangiaceae bacterium]
PPSEAPSLPTSPTASGTPGPASPSPPPSAPTPRAPAEKPQEVQVRGTRPEAGKISVGGAEVRQVPGAFGDAFRMMEALPGVTPIVSGLPFFFVRGAPPGNTGYFIDGVRVPLLYHLAAGPSVIHPGLVDRVDFYPGGYPAQYGRFAGGILAGTTRPPADEFHGEGNLRLLDAGLLMETPFADGRGSVLASGRYGYPGLILPLFAPKNRLAYWDYQGRVSWKFDDRNTVSAFWFGSYDYLAEIKTDPANGNSYEHQLFSTTFHRLDLRFDHRFDQGNLRVAVTLGTDKSGADTGDATSQMLGVRAELEEKLSPDIRMRAGADVFFEHFDLLNQSTSQDRATINEENILYAPRNDLTLGAYVDAVWRLAPRVEVVPGLRADLFTSRRTDVGVVALAEPPATELGIDPRLAVRVTLTPKVTLASAFGIVHQAPSLIVPIPGAGLAKLSTGLQTAVQMSQGLELSLPGDFTATGTLFLNNFLNLTDATATCLGNDVNNNTVNPAKADSCLSQRVRGRAYGMEILIKRALTRRITGWLSYTLSRSTRETNPASSQNGFYDVAGFIQHVDVGPPSTILSEFDRTHVLNVIGAYDLGNGWRAGARFFFYTGRPYSNQFFGNPVPPYNNLRLPSYYRIDVRLEKEWKIGQKGRVSFILEGLNVTLNKEAVGVQCEQQFTFPPFGIQYSNIPPKYYDRCSSDEVGPVTIPSIGLEGAF